MTSATILRTQGASAAMSHLARTFPCFRDMRPEARERIGIDPWNVERLLAYARSGAPGSGGRATCKFLLSIWNDENWPKLGRFTLQDAQSWDPEHRQAFADWARDWALDPWIP